MFDFILLLSAIILFIYTFYKWTTRNNDFFVKRGIPFIKPTFWFGSSKDFFLKKIPLSEWSRQLYTSYPTERLIGYFDLTKPVYLIRDPELFKQIAIKDIDSFEDRQFLIDGEVDSLLGNTVFLMRGKKWRDMRSTLSPAFTGSKMRIMFDLVRNCALNTSNHFRDITRDTGVLSVEMLDVLSRYSTDVIATCSYGINVNSIKDRENEFYINGKRMSEEESLTTRIKFCVQRFAPQIMKFFGIQYYDRDLRVFLTKMVLDNMDVRQKEGINRPDMIDILMKVKEGTLSYQEDRQPLVDGFANVMESNIGKAKVNHKWTDLELISQCFVFFLAGYDTITSLLVAAVYELALNPDVQKRLIEEIDETEKHLNGSPLSYESLQKMEYMDMVISEVLRIRPNATLIDRICTKEYEFDLDGHKVKIEKGTQMWIPIYGYHHDPKYFPNPDKFDPERFSAENKKSINMSVYIPFGAGPRSCLGSRFALMEGKAQLYYILRDFSLEVNSKTEIPMKIKPTPIGVYPENGLHLNIRLRK